MSAGEMHEVISLFTPAPGQPDPVSGQWRGEERPSMTPARHPL